MNVVELYQSFAIPKNVDPPLLAIVDLIFPEKQFHINIQ